PDPLAAGDAPRPLVVAARIAHQRREERRLPHLPYVHQPHEQRDAEDRQRDRRRRGRRRLGNLDDSGGFLFRQRWYASPRGTREVRSTKSEVRTAVVLRTSNFVLTAMSVR